LERLPCKVWIEFIADFIANSLGRLTKESTQEQKGAGLGDLSDEEIQFFQETNEAYKTKFGMYFIGSLVIRSHRTGFPFIICVKFNKKDAIKEAMPKR
jgi:2-oxo-4-hydroxy-4-carboxy-5-ureidoimidazoline decarboxylase